MKVAVIINPVSGSGRRPGVGAERLALAHKTLSERSIAHQVFVTTHRGHARDIAAACVDAGAELVFAWGGDGTVNEIGGVLASRDVTLGIIPAGSGNGLARELRIDCRPEVAITSALAGTDRRIDAAELDGRLFFNVAGVGFDAHVARQFNARELGRRGVLPYAMITLASLFSYRPAAYTVEADGERVFDGGALFIALANATQYGSGARIAPRARLDDGAIDLVIVRPAPALLSLVRIRRLFDGTVERVPGVAMRRITRAVITSREPMLAHVDGEIVQPGTRAELRVHPGALRLRVPPPPPS
ncbi:MAG: diacylglycerol kinase family lipid kinase [Acidobacteria bacterium]|nr:diacylglycerol kinase family lipid kinase [Acidobacteriota bacterium]